MRKQFTKFLRAGTLISTVAFIGATVVQIYARFFMASAPSWTEEAARVFFIYTMCFAAGLAFKDGHYVYLDLIYQRLSSSARYKLDLAILIATILLFGVVGWFAIEFAIAGIPEKSPSLAISMAFPFAAIGIMCAGLIYFSFGQLKKLLR